MNENENKPKHIEKFRIILCIIALAIIIFILSSKSVNVKPDITMNFNSPATYGNNYLGENAHFVTPYVANGVAIPFGQYMNSYNENLTIRNSEIFSPRDTFLNFLQVRKPAVGDAVYLTLDIKNNGNAFDSYADYILTDENDYILNSSVLANFQSSYYNICKGQHIQIGPAQEKTLNIKVNTQDFMNNGNYKVYVIFYNLFTDSRNPNCGQVNSQETFYAIIPFTLNQESSNLGIISSITIIYAIILSMLYLFLHYITQISRFAGNKNTLDKMNWFRRMIEKHKYNLLFYVILFFAIILLISSTVL